MLGHAYFWQLPKTDLHRHIDGSVKSDLIVKRALKDGVILPTYDVQEFSKINTIRIDDVRQGPMDIDQLLKRFAWAIAVMRTPKGLQEVCYNQVLDLAEENILYAELRFAPGYHSKYPAPFYDPKLYEREPFRVMGLDEVMNHAIAGIERGMRETGIDVNLTLCIPRETISMYGVESARDIAKLAVRYRDWGVVSLDLACNEFSYPPAPYAQIFQSTIGTKLRRNPHAGEMGATDDDLLDNIKTCLIHLRADGIGHAIPLWKDWHLTEAVINRRIRIERNPYDNGETHGLGELLDRGVLISVCSDDPVLMKQSLSDCYSLAAHQNSWQDKQINKAIANGVNSAFYRDEKQERRVKEKFGLRGIKL